MFAITNLAKNEEEMQFMENLCKVKHLEPDEIDIYNGTLQQLQGGQLWEGTHTESYIKLSF